jgi:hypothetical protein
MGSRARVPLIVVAATSFRDIGRGDDYHCSVCALNDRKRNAARQQRHPGQSACAVGGAGVVVYGFLLLGLKYAITDGSGETHSEGSKVLV